MQEYVTKLKFSLFLAVALMLVSCSNDYRISDVRHYNYEISEDVEVDEEIEAFLMPYREALEAEMNEIVGQTSESMTRAQPESSLGNFVADLILEQGKRYYGNNIHASFVNIGGLRVPNLPAGDLTRGDIFELMPFDNYLVVMEVSGTIIYKICEVIGSFRGWPVSGITMVLNEDRPENIYVQGTPLEREKKYKIVLSDFLADGGDRLSFLVDLPRENLGILFRDAIFDYLERLSESNLKVESKLDGRIKYAQ